MSTTNFFTVHIPSCIRIHIRIPFLTTHPTPQSATSTLPDPVLCPEMFQAGAYTCTSVLTRDRFGNRVRVLQQVSVAAPRKCGAAKDAGTKTVGTDRDGKMEEEGTETEGDGKEEVKLEEMVEFGRREIVVTLLGQAVRAGGDTMEGAVCVRKEGVVQDGAAAGAAAMGSAMGRRAQVSNESFCEMMEWKVQVETVARGFWW